MGKIFEYILAKPTEFFSLLAICTALVYTVVRLLKGFFGLFTRKRKRRKEQERMDKQAERVLEKLGGVETFSALVAEKVVSGQEPVLTELKKDLKALAAMDKCPIELKAYIETVLKGNATLLLQYEENKAKLASKQPRIQASSIQKPVKQEELIQQQEPKKRQKEEITYV